MSRKTSGSRASFSPTQRKACAVLAVCVLAVILTFIASWVLPGKLSLGGSGRYDPQAYPLDTSLGSVLAKTSDAGTDYVSSTLFVGDQFAKSLYDDKVITLDQFAGKDGLTVSSLLNDACVYFAGDSSAYTVPQAVSKMKPRRWAATIWTAAFPMIILPVTISRLSSQLPVRTSTAMSLSVPFRLWQKMHLMPPKRS